MEARMALPINVQLRYWGLAAAVFVGLLWVLGDVILPFVLGGAIAYFLDPVADRLERLGCSRAMATTIITVAVVLVFVVLALQVVPMLIDQTVALFSSAPDIVRRLATFLTERFPVLMDTDSTVRQSLDQLGQTIQSRGGELVGGLVNQALSLLNVILLLVLAPVVAFYLLLDWDRMVAQIDTLLPRDHAPTIRRLAGEIDNTLASFIRGMGTVSLILGTYYAVALMAAGLQFGLVIGFLAGLVTFIPYVGAIVGGALAVGLALFQFWGTVEVPDGDTVRMTTDWLRIGIIAAIFVFGQVIEGNVLTPKLVGSSVGLHPVWLIFALSVFGAAFGFVGLLVAVPVAASLGVLARFGVAQYRSSKLYRGLESLADGGTEDALTPGPAAAGDLGAAPDRATEGPAKRHGSESGGREAE
jgi:predicted PurR-regulated permease PerM